MQLTPNEVTDEKVPEEGSWPKDELSVVTWVSERQKKADQRLSEWYEAARLDFGFYENKQWSEDDVAKLESEKRVAVTFNRVAPTINAICGQEVANRQEVKFLPRKLGEVNAADPMNDAVKWFRENCNAEDEDSDAFKDMTICGMGWTVSQMNYEINPEGEPEVQRRDPLLMRWDTSARQKNLADRKWNQSDYWMAKEEIEERWPDSDLSALTNLRAPNEGNQPHDSTEAWKYKNDASGFDHYQDQWRVVHHVERFTVAIHRVVDPATQQIKTYSAAELKMLKERTAAAGMPEPQAVAGRKRVFWEAWTVGKTVLFSGVAKIQKDFQYQCMTCVRERETGYWFGIVRLMIDPQRYANRMASLMMSILATGAKGGMLFETGAFANPKKAKQDWARTDSAIEVNNGFLDKVRAKDPVQLPPGAVQMMEFAMQSIRDCPGVNLEMLGQQKQEQPGIVEDMRVKAGLVILACVFDAKRLYVKRQGVILAEFVTKFLSDGRLIRIWGQTGEQFIPLVRDPSVVEYDMVVDESPASRDVKERTWLVMKEVGPMLMQAGIPIPPEVVDYAPIPQSLALSIKKAIALKAQQPPQPPPEVMIQQMKGEVQAHIEEVKAEAKQAADASRAQADERIALAEARIKAATEQARDQSQAMLEQIRAERDQHTAIITAIIKGQAQVASAEITASKDTDEEGRKFTKSGSYAQ